MKRNFNITILLAIFAILLLGGSPVCAAAKESKIPDSAIGRNGDYCAMKSGAEGEEIFGDSGVSGESDKTAKGLNDDSGFAKKCEGGGLNFADNGKPRKSTDPVIGTKRRPDPAMERTIKVNTR